MNLKTLLLTGLLSLSVVAVNAMSTDTSSTSTSSDSSSSSSSAYDDAYGWTGSSYNRDNKQLDELFRTAK